MNTVIGKILVNLVDLDGIGNANKSIDNFFSNKTNTLIIKKLISKLNIQNYSAHKNNGKFSNKKLMFTGVSKYEQVRGKSNC